MSQLATRPDYQPVLNDKDLQEYPELLACIDYLIMKDSEDHLTMAEITAKLSERYGLSKTVTGIYYTVEKWRQNGTLDKAKQIYLAPKMEEMRAAIFYAINKMPQMIVKMVDDTVNKDGTNRTSLDVMIFLSQLVQGELLQSVAKGGLEKKFSQTSQTFDPVDIPD